MKRGAALLLAMLAACSAATSSSGLGPAEQSVEASAAIAAAIRCTQAASYVTAGYGYTLAVDQATAHRDPKDSGRWIVMFPPGVYMGRLPPPGPGEPLLIAVNPSKDSRCTNVPVGPPTP